MLQESVLFTFLPERRESERGKESSSSSSSLSNPTLRYRFSNELVGGVRLNRCVPFRLDYVYEPFTSAFMIKFIDASVINGTTRPVDAKIIPEIQCPDLMRLNYN